MKYQQKMLIFLMAILAHAVFIVGCGDNSASTSEDLSVNSPPEIVSLTATPNSVGIGSITSIVVEAIDPEGDILFFGWNASGGGITGNGPTAVWNAPENMGIYIVSVFIEDDRLGRVNGTIDIEVIDAGSDNRAPIINFINSSPDIIPALGQTQITVGAIDPDGDDNALIYSWGGPGGIFEEAGSSVIWTAPDPGCCPTALSVWVVVSDSEGATNTRSTSIVVIP